MNVSDQNSISGRRRFNFKLSEKKATSNLLKGADREHLQIETKQNCTNFRFSTGAYILVAKKLIKECEDRFKNGTAIAHTDLKITVDEFKTGLELNNKHFDTCFALASKVRLFTWKSQFDKLTESTLCYTA